MWGCWRRSTCFSQVFLVCFDRLRFSRFTCVKSNRLSPHRLIIASMALWYQWHLVATKWLPEAVKVYFPCSGFWYHTRWAVGFTRGGGGFRQHFLKSLCKKFTRTIFERIQAIYYLPKKIAPPSPPVPTLLSLIFLFFACVDVKP